MNPAGCRNNRPELVSNTYLKYSFEIVKGLFIPLRKKGRGNRFASRMRDRLVPEGRGAAIKKLPDETRTSGAATRAC